MKWKITIILDQAFQKDYRGEEETWCNPVPELFNQCANAALSPTLWVTGCWLNTRTLRDAWIKVHSHILNVSQAEVIC